MPVVKYTPRKVGYHRRMAHISQEEQQHRLTEALVKVPLGTKYVHYKNTDRTYTVIGHALLEATDEAAVIYESDYGNHIPFIRPLEDFLAIVTVEGTEVPRFKKV